MRLDWMSWVERINLMIQAWAPCCPCCTVLIPFDTSPKIAPILSDHLFTDSKLFRKGGTSHFVLDINVVVYQLLLTNVIRSSHSPNYLLEQEKWVNLFCCPLNEMSSLSLTFFLNVTCIHFPSKHLPFMCFCSGNQGHEVLKNTESFCIGHLYIKV